MCKSYVSCNAAVVRCVMPCCSGPDKPLWTALFYAQIVVCEADSYKDCSKKSVFYDLFFFILHLFPFNGELSPPVAVFWATAYPKRSEFWCSHFWITLSSQSRCISPSLLLSSHLIWDLLLILSDFKILTIDAGKSLLPNILHLLLS